MVDLLLQSWKKRLGQFVRFGSKSLPLSPDAMLIRVMLTEAASGRPTLIDGGVGKDMKNGALGGFFKTMHCPKCPYNREHWDNCNKVGQVSQLFFSRIVEVKMCFIMPRY